MTFKEMVKTYGQCFEYHVWNKKRYKVSVLDIGVWKGDQWLGDFITLNKTVKDFKNWVKWKGYEECEFRFVGGYTEL